MIDVALAPQLLGPCDVAVVIDVLRATSTATQALAAGYRRVLLADGLELARGMRGPRRVLAGERRCAMPEGFDLGNSPRGVRRARGEELVLATTNGTPTVVAAARQAPQVLLGCLLNLDAVTEVLRAASGDGRSDVLIVCAGTGGTVALEDVYVAGRLCSELQGERRDAARVAEAVARSYATPFDALAASENAAALRQGGLEQDISDCAAVSTLEVVPRVLAASDGVAVATAWTAAPAAPAEPFPRVSSAGI